MRVKSVEDLTGSLENFLVGFFSSILQQFPADLVKFTEGICNGKLHFLCSARYFVAVLCSDLQCSTRNHCFLKSDKLTHQNEVDQNLGRSYFVEIISREL